MARPFQPHADHYVLDAESFAKDGVPEGYNLVGTLRYVILTKETDTERAIRRAKASIANTERLGTPHELIPSPESYPIAISRRDLELILAELEED